jgi:hypothetical protein
MAIPSGVLYTVIDVATPPIVRTKSISLDTPGLVEGSGWLPLLWRFPLDGFRLTGLLLSSDGLRMNGGHDQLIETALNYLMALKLETGR